MPVLGGGPDTHTHPAPSKTVVVPHTWAISGEGKVASGDTDFIVPFYVRVPASGQTVKIRGGRAKTNVGTISAAINVNDAQVIAATNFGTGGAELADPNWSFNTNATSRVNLILSAPSGTPKNITVTIFLEYTF